MTPDTPADGALDDAIAELRRLRTEMPNGNLWAGVTFGASDAILNAAASGQLIPLETCNAVEALRMERDRFESALSRACLVGGTTYLVERAEKAEAERDRLAADGALAQCCMCGNAGLSTAEDGGPECELHDGRWVCSSECWDTAVSIIDRLIPRPAEPAQAAQVGWGPWRTDISEWDVTTHDVRFECIGGIHKISTRPRADLIPRPAEPAQAAQVDLVAKLPRLTEAMIIAACKAHYGSKIVDQLGIDGIDLATEAREYTFRDGFKRMWSGVRAVLRANATDASEGER